DIPSISKSTDALQRSVDGDLFTECLGHRSVWAYGDEAGARADLSFARVSQGEVEGAYEALAPVLGLPVEQRTAGIVASVMRVHGALRQAQYNGNGAV